MSSVTDNIMQDKTPLTDEEHARLQQLEQIISLKDSGYILIGNALTSIRDQKLYRDVGATFEKYIVSRFEMNRRTAYRYIDAAFVNKQLEDAAKEAGVTNLATQRESVLRPLVRVPEAYRHDVLDHLVRHGLRKRGRFTARTVECAIQDKVPAYCKVRVAATLDASRRNYLHRRRVLPRRSPSCWIRCRRRCARQSRSAGPYSARRHARTSPP